MIRIDKEKSGRLPAGRLAPAIAAPVLFAGGAVFSKPLLATVDPVMMAGLLYLSAGLALSLWRLALSSAETPVQKGDVPRLAAVALFGGLAAPLLLMLGLSRIPAASASLLLNLEAPLTALLAAALFREHVGGRTAVGVALVAAGSASLAGLAARGDLLGYAAVAAACLCWALDNNLTGTLAERDPLQVAAVKGSAAGACNLGLALLLGARVPGAARMGAIAAIGAVSYGASLAFYLMSLRRLGAARTAMFFGLAPFFGALLAVSVLKEPLTPALAIAAALMALGTWIGTGDGHEHLHAHEQAHEHLHVHDEHHGHHARPVAGPHSHPHSHAGLSHSHPHEPDIHHRH